MKNLPLDFAPRYCLPRVAPVLCTVTGIYDCARLLVSVEICARHCVVACFFLSPKIRIYLFTRFGCGGCVPYLRSACCVDFCSVWRVKGCRRRTQGEPSKATRELEEILRATCMAANIKHRPENRTVTARGKCAMAAFSSRPNG